ncbi:MULTISPECIES: MarR family winged helix-turn-helix transcriptional regulator [unclassified Moritella]|uniref:MarR family winged helix-turn-helix transcriptional regulator n=1 Tax=unclassified Moritella TaxID=2637987 RepID=UPI001BAC38FE|nr:MULTISPECIES: MarR family transcriptional regulator [unclassified Moritella]QUM79222.1 MarR family transcriptional regulator [Moritella sp. 5]QUM83407.1 MarR family transcriptional regulator [Moritella sp. 28]QUM87713.1 MarR family transcriptional regulator [Moritella sp. 36]
MIHSKFGFLSYEISHIIRQRFNKQAESMGITHSQWRALVHLSENENCRQIDLADILNVKPITLARQIDLLEELSLVKRVNDKEDRRVFRLKLTTKAKPIIKELWNIADAIENEICNMLSDEEKEILSKLLITIKKQIN